MYHKKSQINRFKKLAGLITESRNPVRTKMLSEGQVSHLLREGYTYRDIALMEQNWPDMFTTLDPKNLSAAVDN